MKAQFNTGGKSYLTYASVTVLLSLSIAASYAPNTSRLANADLRGEWLYNEQKSNQGQANFRIAPMKLKITNEADGIAIEKTTKGLNGGENMISTDRLTFDGKETESTLYGVMKKRSASAWSADGAQLTIHSTILFDRDGSLTQFKSLEIYSLSDNGKSLHIQYSSTTSATMDGIFVYDRVK